MFICDPVGVSLDIGGVILILWRFWDFFHIEYVKRLRLLIISCDITPGKIKAVVGADVAVTTTW